MMAAVDFFLFCFHMIVDGIKNFGLLIHHVALFNYNAVSHILQCAAALVQSIVYVVGVLSQVLSDIIFNVGDFLLEFLFCIKSLMVLIWKFLLLLWYILTFILSSLELTAIALWTGFVWCVNAFTQTIAAVVTQCGTSWSHGKGYINLTFHGIVDGFTSIGKGVENACVMSWTTFVETVQIISHSSVDFVLRNVRAIKSDAKYVFIDVFLSIQKEAYIGVLVCLLGYLLISNMKRIFNYMHSRGLTLPFMGGRTRRNLRLEDSDDEFMDTESEISDRANVTDVSGSDESDAESVGETNDNQSEDNSDQSDIDIRLPNLDDGLVRRGLRSRSNTPCNYHAHPADRSREDLEREVELEKDKRACVVCQDRPKNVLILPCRHLCLCLQCANQIARSHFVTNRICPLCRTRIKTIMDIYV